MPDICGQSTAFLAAQFDAYLNDDLWMDLAAHANQAMSYLLNELQAMSSITVVSGGEGNELFVSMDDALARSVTRQGSRILSMALATQCVSAGDVVYH